MKKIILIALAGTFLVTCTPKATKSVTATAPATPRPDPFEAKLTATKTRFPEATMDNIKQGYSIYYGACTNCHGAKNITDWDEKQWVGILDQMAPEAKLTPVEKDAVWKYIISVKLTAK